LDRERTEIGYNSKWLDALGAAGVIKLAGRYTLARMMERDDFKKRFRENQAISIHELLYPLLQGYDSIALEADVELGGSDQLVNLLVGRDLMKEEGLEPQVILTVPLLVGTDGVEKMSKSLGNAIGLEEEAAEIFGKTMSIPDDLMWDWYLLLTDLAESEISQRKQQVAAGELHPKQLKQELARRLTGRYQGEEAAARAQAEFESVFAQGGVPDDVPSAAIQGEVALAKAIAQLDLASSNREAQRLVQQGAVSIDDEKTTDPFLTLAPRPKPYLLKVGKRRFLELTVS
jgi:tyrosyl-tRNA synthetase